MRLIAPDLLEESLGLSLAIQVGVLLVGLMLWFGGYRWHRFWIVLGVTAFAGLLGLASGRAIGGQVLVFGMLLAVAGGMLAMELARLLAFTIGGFAAWVAVHSLLPHAQDLSVAFLIGGLMGIFLYPLWIMTITSFVGTLFTWYGGLGILVKFTKINAMTLANDRVAMLNAGIALATILGVILQGWLERRLRGKPHGSSHGTGHGKKADTADSDSASTGKESRVKWPGRPPRLVRNIRDLFSTRESR
ncbi:hypothetical protein [Tuwongella immobilis]|uniref:DUF4203 domain-containing protein n=1 Tax=Tuwongella immobilis TaxID=692036 RepID=A0A6C2YSY9_9BACT|nr:hypothetical protein [Tuwongella immobilis]VIP04504.1 Putative uncharacterized protein OS=uncultured planctomycete GN=HGMM_F22C11C06 PE=4 SV=1 [Tuwongella immobilis]VTS06370.1 Putative uncharacterized protein OS=uncultured planctomycete GN=HGMM_F22C11C06 PE=4 SV=1 [Tuwongella immobilis]